MEKGWSVRVGSRIWREDSHRRDHQDWLTRGLREQLAMLETMGRVDADCWRQQKERVDGDGTEIPFSEGNRDKLLDVPMVAVAIGMSFFESLAGAKRKN